MPRGGGPLSGSWQVVSCGLFERLRGCGRALALGQEGRRLLI